MTNLVRAPAFAPTSLVYSVILSESSRTSTYAMVRSTPRSAGSLVCLSNSMAVEYASGGGFSSFQVSFVANVPGRVLNAGSPSVASV